MYTKTDRDTRETGHDDDSGKNSNPGGNVHVVSTFNETQDQRPRELEMTHALKLKH